MVSLVLLVSLFGAVFGSHNPYHVTPSYGHHPTAAPYHPTPYHRAVGYSRPSYHHREPAYPHEDPYKPAHHSPAYASPAPYHPAPYAPKHHAKPHHKVPYCAANFTLVDEYCVEDHEYPLYELKADIAKHHYGFLELYADVADLNTVNSVVSLKELAQETYLCPSVTRYDRPLRAQNTDGKWRVIVNNVKVDYEEFTQTVRTERCTTAGDACPYVPHCYETKCLQKSVYHRFLVYDPYDVYFPFAIETFRLPASCACYAGDHTHY